jgi:hypothetical protein
MANAIDVEILKRSPARFIIVFPESKFPRGDMVTGKTIVEMKISRKNDKIAKYRAKMISVSENGSVRTSSPVLYRLSSIHNFIVRIGTKRITRVE